MIYKENLNKAAESGRTYQLCLQLFCQEEFLLYSAELCWNAPLLSSTVSFQTQKRPESLKIKLSGTPAKESMRQDLNLRPLRPERSALPS